MKSLYLLGVALLMPQSWASTITVDWEANGGANEFNRQAITFAPIVVDEFVGFQIGGHWKNEVNTTGTSSIDLDIFLDIGGNWQRFAFMNVAAPFGAEISLDHFTYLPIDFDQGPLQGINFTEQSAGAGRYQGMIANGGGTQFLFSRADAPSVPIPEPGTTGLMLIGLAGLGARRRK